MEENNASRPTPSSVSLDGEFEYLDQRLHLSPLIESAARESGFDLGRKLTCFASVFRLLMTYCLSTWSSRQTTAWACALGIVPTISHVTMLALLSRSGPFFHALATSLIRRQKDANHITYPAEFKRLLAIDGTCVTSAHHDVDDYERLHLVFEVCQGSLLDFHMPLGPNVAESVCHFRWPRDALVLGDRAYCYPSQFRHVRHAGSRLLTRWPRNKSLYLRGDDGKLEKWDWREALGQLEVGERRAYRLLLTASDPIEVTVYVEHVGTEFAKSELAKNKRNKMKSSAASRQIAPFMVLVSNATLEEVSLEEALEGYRMRWQGAEINIREAKSHQGFSRQVLKSVASRQAWLLAHLCGQLVCQLWQRRDLDKHNPSDCKTRGFRPTKSMSAVLKASILEALIKALCPLSLRSLAENFDTFCAHYLRLQGCSRRQALSHEVYLSKVAPDIDLRAWKYTCNTT